MVTGKLERGTIVTGSACDVLGMDERKKATVAGQCADSLLAPLKRYHQYHHFVNVYFIQDF